MHSCGIIKTPMYLVPRGMGLRRKERNISAQIYTRYRTIYTITGIASGLVGRQNRPVGFTAPDEANANLKGFSIPNNIYLGL